MTAWAPLCMSAEDYADWREIDDRTAHPGSRPCRDCTAAFAAEMRAESLCNGEPGTDVARGQRKAVRLPRRAPLTAPVIGATEVVRRGDLVNLRQPYVRLARRAPVAVERPARITFTLDAPSFPTPAPRPVRACSRCDKRFMRSHISPRFIALIEAVHEDECGGRVVTVSS